MAAGAGEDPVASAGTAGTVARAPASARRSRPCCEPASRIANAVTDTVTALAVLLAATQQRRLGRAVERPVPQRPVAAPEPALG